MHRFSLALIGFGLSLSSIASAEIAQLKLYQEFWLEFGCDEPIHFKGTLHDHSNRTETGPGSWTLQYHVNVSGMKGEGLVTGKKYILQDQRKGSTVVYDPKNYDIQSYWHMNVIPLGGGVHRKVRYSHHSGSINGERFSNPTFSDSCE